MAESENNQASYAQGDAQAEAKEKAKEPLVFGKVDSASEAVAAATQSSFGFKRVQATLRGWWRDEVTGTVDQAAVIEKRRAECDLSERYLFISEMSAGIAGLGLLLS